MLIENFQFFRKPIINFEKYINGDDCITIARNILELEISYLKENYETDDKNHKQKKIVDLTTLVTKKPSILIVTIHSGVTSNHKMLKNIFYFLSNLTFLTSLCVKTPFTINNNLLKTLLKNNNLKKLSLSGIFVKNMNKLEKTFSIINKNNIKHFSIKLINNRNYRSTDVTKSYTILKKIKYLVFPQNISFCGVQEILSSIDTLRKINIKNIDDYSSFNSTLKMVNSNVTHLYGINSNSINNYTSIINLIRSSPNIHTLSVTNLNTMMIGANINDSHSLYKILKEFDNIKNNKHKKILFTHSSYDVVNARLVMINILPSLENINAYKFSFAPTCHQFLPDLTNLLKKKEGIRSITLKLQPNNYSNRFNSFFPESLNGSHSTIMLNKIKIIKFHITKDFLHSISLLPKLRILTFVDVLLSSDNVSDTKNIKYFEQFDKIRNLTLTRFRFQEYTLKSICNLIHNSTTLKSLKLGYSSLKDMDIDLISTSISRNQSLNNLSFVGNNVTSDGLQSLLSKINTNIKKLDMRSNLIDHNMIPNLKKSISRLSKFKISNSNARFIKATALPKYNNKNPLITEKTNKIVIRNGHHKEILLLTLCILKLLSKKTKQILPYPLRFHILKHIEITKKRKRK